MRFDIRHQPADKFFAFHGWGLLFGVGRTFQAAFGLSNGGGGSLKGGRSRFCKG
jgi:hypothetical protein